MQSLVNEGLTLRFDLLELQKRREWIKLGMTSKTDRERKSCLLQVAIAIVTSGIYPETNAFARVDYSNELRGIYKLQRVRPLFLNDGFGHYDELRLDLRWVRLSRRKMRVLGRKG